MPWPQTHRDAARWAVPLLLWTLLTLTACQTSPPPAPPATPSPSATAPPTSPPPATTLTPSPSPLASRADASPRPSATPGAGLGAQSTLRLFFPEIGVGAAPPAGARTPTPGVVARADPPPPTFTPAPTVGPSPTPTNGPSPTPRPTRTPRPTPTPKFPPPLAEPGPSKLGLHVVRNNSPDILEFIRVTKPRVVKAVDDLHWLAEAKQASPQTVTVGRIAVASQSMTGDPAQAARDFVAAQLPDYEFNRAGVDYWEGWNEPAPKTAEEMTWYTAFEAERVRALAEHGLKAAVGTFPTGVPEWDLIPLFLPAVQAAKDHGGVLALHEYSAPTMQYGVGVAVPGRAPVANRGVLTLRYRWWYEDFLKPRGLAIPLVITEAGIDGGITNRPGPGDARGWRDFGGYWSSQGLGGDTLAVYLDQLAWYDRETRQDPYVLGFTVFTAGDEGDTWASFEVTDVLPALARYLVEQK